MAGLGSSRDRAISISSAESSVCGDPDEDQSDTFFPPVKELGSPAKAKKAGSRSIVGMPISAASAPARDSNTTWSGRTANGLDSEGSPRTEKSPGPEGLQPPRALLPLTPPSPVLPASMQAESRPPLTDDTFDYAIQGHDDRDLHDLTGGDDETPLLPSPSRRRLAQPRRPMTAEVQASKPSSLPLSGGDGDDRACPALARLGTAKRARTPGAPSTPAPALYSPRAIAEVEGQASHHPCDQSSPQPLAGYQNQGAVATEGSEGEEGEEDPHPPPKRRKGPASSQSTNPRAATRQPPTSNTGVSRSRKAHRPAASQKHPSRLQTPPERSAQEGADDAAATAAKECPLQNVIFKSAIVDGELVMQIRGSVVPCPEHESADLPADEGTQAGDAGWKVSEILREKLVRGKKFYLVKWEPTWEPRRNLAKDVLSDWEAAQAQRNSCYA